MRLLLLIATLFVTTISMAQDDDAQIPFITYWDLGERFNYRITEVSNSWKDGVKGESDSSTVIIQFEVIDSTATSYKVKMKPGKGYCSSHESLPEEMRKELDALSRMEVIYSMSEMGEYIEIDNWEEIAEMGEKATDIIMKNFTKDLENADAVALFEKMFRSFFEVYTSREGIENESCSFLGFFHLPFGQGFDEYKTYEYDAEVANLFGPDPIKAEARIYFESVDREDERCVFIQETKLDEDDSKNAIKDLFATLGLSNKEINKELKKAKLEISDHNRFEYFYYPGLPILIETKRTTQIEISGEKTKRIAKTRIELLGL